MNGRKLLERKEIVAARAKFIRRICLVEDWSTIIWLDETWVNVNHSPSHSWTDGHTESTMSVPIGKGKKLIIVHVGDMFGFIPHAELIFESRKTNDYHKEMNRDVFMQWFTKKLLPNIPSKSIIVIDNAPYHTTYKERALTTASCKQEIIDWLLDHDIPTEEDILTYSKAELLLTVAPYKQQFTKYKVDEIVQENGHEVFRLPPYHCQYNPIELIWSQVKGYIGKENREFNMRTLKTLTVEAIENITPTNWFTAVEHCKKLIFEAQKAEGLNETAVEDMIITLQPSDNEDSDSDSAFELKDESNINTIMTDIGVNFL